MEKIKEGKTKSGKKQARIVVKPVYVGKHGIAEFFSGIALENITRKMREG